MKAAVYTQYGNPEVLKVVEVAKPAPKDNEILVKVNATTVSAGDWRMRAGEPFAIKLYNGWPRPKRTVLGHEFAGVVAAVGTAVTRFRKGDRIFGTTGANAGAHAEYVVVTDDKVIVPTPDNISDSAAAALPVGATTALFFLRKINLQPGNRILIYGASGSVGTYAVQLAKHFGAEVTAVCSSANVAMVQSLGADKVIDYTKEDFTTTGAKYHVLFDAVGKASFRTSKAVLAPGGSFLTVAMSIPLLFQSLLASVTGEHTLISAITKSTNEDLLFISELAAQGKLKAVIEQTYTLSEIAAAHEHAQTGHKKGNIVVIPNQQ